MNEAAASCAEMELDVGVGGNGLMEIDVNTVRRCSGR